MRRLPIILLSLLAMACSSIDCPVNNIVSTQYVICDKDGAEMKLSDTLSILTRRMDDTITVLNRLVQKATFSLQISNSHPEDELFFVFYKGPVYTIDTVWIKKDDYPHFESVDCNAAFFHTLTGVRYTTHYIDSIVIKNTSVNYDVSTVHFHLYPKVSN